MQTRAHEDAAAARSAGIVADLSGARGGGAEPGPDRDPAMPTRASQIVGRAVARRDRDPRALILAAPTAKATLDAQAAWLKQYPQWLGKLQGFADVQMGFGVLITGLAAVIIGETLIGRDTVARQVGAPVARVNEGSC